MVLLLALAACREKVVADCDTRIPFYPDPDGDGLGQPTDLYLGCHPPPGWVAVLEPHETGTTGDTAGGDTGGAAPTLPTSDTADTGG